MDIRVIRKLHDLIQAERTGPPVDCASKLNVSERTVFNYLAYMKNEMNAPIVYDLSKSSYRYNKICMFNFENQ